MGASFQLVFWLREDGRAVKTAGFLGFFFESEIKLFDLTVVMIEIYNFIFENLSSMFNKTKFKASSFELIKASELNMQIF